MCVVLILSVVGFVLSVMVETYEGGEGSRGQCVGRAAEVTWFIQPREEEAEGRLLTEDSCSGTDYFVPR